MGQALDSPITARRWALEQTELRSGGPCLFSPEEVCSLRTSTHVLCLAGSYTVGEAVGIHLGWQGPCQRFKVFQVALIKVVEE
jgi:hypothetical protein